MVQDSVFHFDHFNDIKFTPAVSTVIMKNVYSLKTYKSQHHKKWMPLQVVGAQNPIRHDQTLYGASAKF